MALAAFRPEKLGVKIQNGMGACVPFVFGVGNGRLFGN
jgi:hypothetical protein